MTHAGNAPHADACELIAVMPVFNEAACIERVVRGWIETLARETPAHRLLVLDDGSTDGTGPRLDALARELPTLEVLHHANRGHGPTILEGYRRAVARAEWVFQTDSDDELPPEGFAALWRARDAYDLLLGERRGRRGPVARRAVTAAARWTVALLFAPGVRDVNIPFRLMRAAMLQRLLPLVPADTFAPNVILSGMAARAGYRIFQTPVGYRPRRTGRVSIRRWKLLKAAARAFAQTLAAARRARPLGRTESQGSRAP